MPQPFILQNNVHKKIVVVKGKENERVMLRILLYCLRPIMSDFKPTRVCLCEHILQNYFSRERTITQRSSG